MATIELLPEDPRGVESIRQADIVVGVPRYNNARTIGYVMRAVCAGLAKYYPQLTAVIVNSDSGSTDKTREEILSAPIENSHLIFAVAPLVASHRLSLPFHGVPGKSNALRSIFK